jgi:EAL domain-containing protein (putative c-di-GMP-specific phosphodiesterase class I)
VLIAGQGEDLTALQECLRAAGWDSVRAQEPEECRATVQALGCELVVVFPTPGEDCGRWRLEDGLAARVSVVLALDTSSGAAEEALDRCGAMDVIELPLRPGLALRRLAFVLRLRGSGAPGAAAVEDGGKVSRASSSETSVCDLHPGRGALVEALRGELAIEGRTEGQAAVFVLRATCPKETGSELESREWRERLDSLAEILGVLASDLGSSRAGDGASSRVGLARLEEDRFAFFVVGVEDLRDGERRGTELHETLLSHWADDPRSNTVNLNIGVAVEPIHEADAKRLLEHAETACYCARQQGRRKVQPYSDYMSLWAGERRSLIEGLKQAVEKDELVVHYQPRIDAQTRRVLGMEALVRWVHPEMGMIPPIKFSPLAEESGLIESIGEWVLRTACRQNREWQDLGYTPIRMSVNLSAVQFHQPELFETVAAVLEATGLDARWLELELTESMLMNDPRTTIATLRRFKDVGIHLSIDDFGTGYSSLSYLKRFPIDALKIDRSVVREITTNPDDAAIATAIILLGHSLKLDVVAEGVETESQLSFLQILQCNEIQGYLISPPGPAAKAQNFLVAHRAITIS